MRKISISLIGFLAVCILSGCGSDSAPTTDTATVAKPAKLLKVGFSEDYALLRYPAVVDSSESTTLAFQVSGEILEVPVNESDEVKRGDLLARLDPQNFQDQVNIAQAQFDLAKTAYDSAVSLSAEDAIAGNILDQRKSDFDVAEANLNVAQKALNDTRIVAPFDGVVSAVPVKVRETVQAGTSAISVIGRGGLEARINLPAAIVARSRSNAEVNKVFVTLEAAPDRRIDAAFKEASLVADNLTQTFEITVSFDEQDDLAILPGMNASVWIQDPEKVADSKRVAIPLTAVSINGDEKSVYIVDTSTMIISKRVITAEEEASTSLNIITGLESGDTIVAVGVSSLSEGMTVSAWSSTGN